ncbi:MAG: hypothetical protein COZ46_02930 [Verrucomicrobia bacterium CG_4_10_14_3_um_filter_43_23]|nr:MAG: hypothetical protein AUJ82_00995 [Verrucomicrobia bacterium CG1_02_43_26]PIP59473.1 MAG: hypothetical protein COX01_02555 [Verrucomicrobia bacterium CG22_combo_CG10-13_8_21_14_all_43_17]PIX58634.1 MAG: hypothetical protein COZ46_02930 [Verrucomicrobia bacterium CG_4_10_14_3_um_filter_43_23]PIY61459.1 MAG: hypothetical protein COY94_05295 [Verrucomicrobia bacterium CG_4_10_14_0_8_um_filter_43_34]PJA43826.1 MAG: hypothetical protein CO175_06215 [Verrucomicrobia bacterium CG_4_9_14_3_um_fi
MPLLLLTILLTPFSTLTAYPATKTTTSNSIYTDGATTQKVIDSRKASSDPYYYNPQNLIRKAKKQKPQTDTFMHWFCIVQNLL